MNDEDDEKPPMLLSKKEVCRRVGLSFTTIWKRIPEGKFPPSYENGDGGKTVWRESDIDAYIRSLRPRSYKGAPPRNKK